MTEQSRFASEALIVTRPKGGARWWRWKATGAERVPGRLFAERSIRLFAELYLGSRRYFFNRRVIIQNSVEPIEIDWLDQEIVASFCDRVAAIFLRILTRDNNDRDIHQLRVLSQAVNHPKAVEPWQLQIEQNQIRFFTFGNFDGLFTVPCLNDAI